MEGLMETYFIIGINRGSYVLNAYPMNLPRSVGKYFKLFDVASGDMTIKIVGSKDEIDYIKEHNITQFYMRGFDGFHRDFCHVLRERYEG